MKKKNSRRKNKVINDYDAVDTTGFIDAGKPLRFADLGLKLPEVPPTQVISIRLPSQLLHEIKALCSQRDIPYQAMIKLFLDQSLKRYKKQLA